MITQFGVNMNIYTRTLPCIVAYDFESGGGTVIDRSGNDNDGTVTGAVFSTTQKKEGTYAMYFDGNDKVQLTDLASLEGANSFSGFAWVYHNDDTNVGIITKDELGGSRCWGLSMDPTNEVKISMWESGGANYAIYSGNGTVPANTWTHVGFTWNHDTKEMVIYVNGDAKDTYTWTGKTIRTGTDKVHVGWMYSNSYAFTGYIDAVHIFTIALSATQVDALYNIGKMALDAHYGDTYVTYEDQGAEKVLISEDVQLFDQTEGGTFSQERYTIYLLSTTNLGSDDRVVYGGNTYDCKDLQPMKLPDGTVIAYRAEIEKIP